MKNILLYVTNGLLVVSVAVLFYLQFSTTSSSSFPETKVVSADSLKSKPVLDGVAYINVDSLLVKYQYYTDLGRSFEAKTRKMESEYQSRAQRYQEELNSYQQLAPTMTMGQRQSKEESLVKKQQELMQYQQDVSQQLAMEEANLIDQLYLKVSDFLTVYGKENGLSLIVTYTKGSGVWYAHESLDITSEVIDGLNARYDNEKASN